GTSPHGALLLLDAASHSKCVGFDSLSKEVARMHVANTGPDADGGVHRGCTLRSATPPTALALDGVAFRRCHRPGAHRHSRIPSFAAADYRHAAGCSHLRNRVDCNTWCD